MYRIPQWISTVSVIKRIKQTVTKRQVNNMLFEKEIKEAEEKLYKKEYYVSNMTAPNNDLYEIYDRDGNVAINYLSVAQLIQLSNMI